MVDKSLCSEVNFSLKWIGVQAYADALLVIPKTLAVNSGLDAQETIVKLQEEYASVGQPVGLDISSGKGNVKIYW